MLNAGDAWLDGREIPGQAAQVTFLPPGEEGEGADLEVADGQVTADGRALLPAREIGLLGPHNVANAMAAAAAGLSFGLPDRAVAEGLAGFSGVAHRLEPVGEVDGVLWVNDSKATNVLATTTALAAFPGGVRLILGGTGKGEDYGGLAAPVGEACVAVYLIGENAAEIAAGLGESGLEPVQCGDLESAVEAAHRDAAVGETVLLSPASASFDQFRDFEERGERFRSLIGGLGAR